MENASVDERRLDRRWWKEAVVYQVYPRSFRDSDGDGVGDLPGVVEKVDYLDSLGVDVVWLCPVYDSPNADNGYDVRDYRSIADEFGTMADWETLRDELHARDMRLIMDLVVNHTSDEHEWFRKSRRREDGYEDYYYWRDGAPDEPPNNWESFFGGSAWTYDDVRGQWYLHLFDEKQPDLNWRTPTVREDVESIVRWWLEKGIDGFRIDAINYISKAEGLPDGEASRTPTGVEQFRHGPRIHEYLRGLYDRVFSNYDAMTVGAIESLVSAGAIESYEEVRGLVNYASRDHSRTPMQWSDAPHAGFTDGEPWFGINENYREINVEAALADEGSVWHHYRSLMDLRGDDEALVYGDYELLAPDHERVYAYLRSPDDEARLVALNWSDAPATFDPADAETADAEVLIGNYEDPPADPARSEFRPYEAVVYAL